MLLNRLRRFRRRSVKEAGFWHRGVEGRDASSRAPGGFNKRHPLSKRWAATKLAASQRETSGWEKRAAETIGRFRWWQRESLRLG